MRLNAFFSKPVASDSNTTTFSGSIATQTTGTKPTINCSGNTSVDRNPDDAPIEQKVLLDYEREFPAFFLHSHVKIAPLNRFERDTHTLKHIHQRVDAYLKKDDAVNGSRPAAITVCPTQLF